MGHTLTLNSPEEITVKRLQIQHSDYCMSLTKFRWVQLSNPVVPFEIGVLRKTVLSNVPEFMTFYVCFLLLPGCQLLIYPGAFNLTTGPAHWELLIRARAADNQCYVAAVSPARDISASYIVWGHTSIAGPW